MREYTYDGTYRRNGIQYDTMPYELRDLTPRHSPRHHEGGDVGAYHVKWQEKMVHQIVVPKGIEVFYVFLNVTEKGGEYYNFFLNVQIRCVQCVLQVFRVYVFC